ncbi:MAG: HAD family hydrolase [Candidatus Thorarchaeota archaeon]
MVINALLFDMDSTIIQIEEYDFSKNYFQLLHNHYFPELDMRFFYQSMHEITKNVMINSFPKEFTMETFMREMSSKFNQTPEELYVKFMSFYNNEYDKLEKYISPMKGVKNLMNECIERGFEIIVATTPVFPEVAITKRLKWGGLGDFDFKLVTHAENMHFSKPRVEYYIEILSYIKKKVTECMMIGNEFIGDIVGPTKLGMKTFYCPVPSINEEFYDSPEFKKYNKIKPNYTGSIADFTDLLNNGLQ